MFVEHKDFVWGLIASMYLGDVVGLIIVLTTVPIFASILRVPFAAVAPIIVMSCAIAAYEIQHAKFDIWLRLGFGVVFYIFKKIGIFGHRSRWLWCSATAPKTLPAVDDRLRPQRRRVLVERPGRHYQYFGDHAAVLAGDRARLCRR